MLKISFVAAMAMLVLGGCGPSEKESAAAKDAAEQAAMTTAMKDELTRMLKDPGAAQFRDERLTAFGAALCGEVNSKNSFGAYGGFKRFVVVKPVGAYLDGEGGDFAQAMFTSNWNTHCQAPAAR